MKKYRKWLIAIFIVVVLALLSATSYQAMRNDVYAVNDYYTIMRDGDGYKLLLTEYGRTFDSGSAFFGPLTFSSVQQMKYKLLTGDFTQKEASYIKQLDPGGSLYKYCIDFDDLYEAVLPQGVRQTRIVWGGGTRYSIRFSHSLSYSENYIITIGSGAFRNYREYVNKSYYENEDNPNLTYLKSELISERNAVAHHFSRNELNGVKNYVDLWYELTTEDKTLYVQECYELSEYQRTGIPYEINILGKDAEYYYKIVLEEMRMRPTEEWLLSFGLKPYVETN